MSALTQGVPTHDLAEEFLDRRTPLNRLRDVLHRYPAISPAVVLVLAVIVFGLLNDRFLDPANLSLITQQVAVVGTLAVAQTLIILTAGIDLSVGASMVLASMVIAQTASANGLPGPVALHARADRRPRRRRAQRLPRDALRLPPFIVTLGTLNIFVALTLLYSNGATVRGAEMPGHPDADGRALSIGDVRITVGVVIMLALYIVVAFILGKTAWGRHVYAVGDDKEAARLAGISVNRVLMSVYLAAGAILAIGAWIQIGEPTRRAPTPASTSTSTRSPPSSSAARACSAVEAWSGAPCSVRSSSGCSATGCRSRGSTCSTRRSPSASSSSSPSRSTSGFGRCASDREYLRGPSLASSRPSAAWSGSTA